MKDTDVYLPKYKQIEKHLIKKIKSRKYSTGEKLPSEREISSMFNVSRMTARKALTAIVDEGYAQAIIGKGTFVRSSAIRKSLTSLEGFSKMLKERGKTIQSMVIKFEIIEADSHIASNLGLPIGQEIYRLTRIRKVDSEPVALEDCYLNKSLFPDLLKYDFSTTSLFSTMREIYNVFPFKGSQTIEICLAKKWLAERMEIKLNSPLFLFKGSTYSSDNTPIEYLVSYIRGDKYIFYNELKSEEI